MSNLLKNTSLTLNRADKIISDTLHKCDDGELYLEDTKFETVTLDDNKIIYHFKSNFITLFWVKLCPKYIFFFNRTHNI